MKKKGLTTEESVCFRMKTGWQAIAKLYNTSGAPYDITASTGYVVLNIDLEKGTPATKIAPKLGMEPGSLTRMLKAMEEKGDIYRTDDPTDGRVTRVFLTEQGRHKRELAKMGVVTFNKVVRQAVPEEKLRIFFEVSDMINRIIENKTITEKVSTATLS